MGKVIKVREHAGGSGMQKPMGENSSQWFETLLVLGFGPQNLELPFSTVKNIFVFFNMRAWLRLKDDSEQEGRWGLVIIFQFSLFMSFRLSFFHSPHYSIPSVRYFSCLALHAQCSTPIPFFQLFCFPREFHFFLWICDKCCFRLIFVFILFNAYEVFVKMFGSHCLKRSYSCVYMH